MTVVRCSNKREVGRLSGHGVINAVMDGDPRSGRAAQQDRSLRRIHYGAESHNGIAEKRRYVGAEAAAAGAHKKDRNCRD